MRDFNNTHSTSVKNSEINSQLRELLAGFLSYDRDRMTREVAIGLVVEEATKRPSFDLSLFKERLDGSKLSIVNKCAFIERKIIPEIKDGNFDGKPKEARKPLSSRALLRKLRSLGVVDDSDDGYGLERVDYYLNAVWGLSEIPLEDIRRFTASMVVWVEARAEWRAASKILQLCKMSKILGSWLSPDIAAAKVEEEASESKKLDMEFGYGD